MKENKIIAEYLGYKYFPFNDLQEVKVPGWYRVVESKNSLSSLIYHFKDGWKRVNDTHYKYICRSTNDLGFNSSWDSLMPVIQKIEKSNDFHFELYGNGAGVYDVQANEKNICNFDKENTWVQNTYSVVIEVINKINENGDKRS